MWFGKQIKSQSAPPTLLQELTQLQQLRREAKAEFDRDWKNLHSYLNTNPPLRKPFMLNDKIFFAPVNFLASVPPEQRALESQVVRSRSRWNKLQEQEADMLRRLGKIK